MESQNEIIKTLNEDLNYAHEEIKRLKNHTLQLETLVLKKEENIIILEKQVQDLNIIINRPSCSKYLTSNKRKHHSLPMVHSTPVLGNVGFRDRAWSSEKNPREAFPAIRKGRNVASFEPVECNAPPTTSHQGSAIITRNRFEVLSTDEGEEAGEKADSNEEGKDNPKKNKILCCADSHGRDLAWHLNKIQKKHETVSFVRPGGCTRQVLNIGNIEQENLGKNDVLVIIAGSNDVAKNEADEMFDHMSKTLENTCGTNVVLVELPNRYDLVDWSCVNKEVAKTNLRLKELSYKYSHATIVKASRAVRSLHTQHGQHFNIQGKQWLAKLIAEQVENITTKDSVPISQKSHTKDTFPSPARETPSGNYQPLQPDKHPIQATNL